MIEQTANASPGVVGLRAGLAWTLCWLDRRAEAAAILKQAASDRFEHVLPASDELAALVLYADAAVQTGDVDASSILHERIEPFADQIDWNGATSWGHARMYLGLLAGVLGKHEQADQHLAFVCEFQEANGMLLSAARAQLGGRRRWPNEAMPGERRSTQPARSSSRASTATACLRSGQQL